MTTRVFGGMSFATPALVLMQVLVLAPGRAWAQGDEASRVAGPPAREILAAARQIDALIEADKDFDFIVVPGMGHSGGGNYGERRRRDFFVRHLLGVEPRWETDSGDRR